MADDKKAPEHREPKTYKLQGEAFEKVKAAVDKHKAAHQAVEDTHKEMWEAIGEFVPEVETHVQHRLKTDYEEHGIYFVEEEHECPGCGQDHSVAHTLGGEPIVIPMADAPPFLRDILRRMRGGDRG